MLSTDGVDVTAALNWAGEVVIGPFTDVRELAGGRTSTMLSLTSRAGRHGVLRLMTREPWRSYGHSLTTREREIQQMLVSTPVPAPRSLALDADGRDCGHPAHLMSRLPGGVDLNRVDAVSLVRLADQLATIHDVAPTMEVRAYQSWASEAKHVAPPWTTDPRLWEEAFALLRTDPPAYEPCFIHRDFQLGNVLWDEGGISGVVDWVETSIGPAWLDVAHCCTNIAIGHGTETAEAFASAYVERTGRQPQPYFDVMDVVGFLPPPGVEGFFTEATQLSRMEEWLRSVMGRVTG